MRWISSGLTFTVITLNILSLSSQPVWENLFLSVPNAESAREHLNYITSFSHVAGTEGDYQEAQYVNNLFLSYGLNSTIVPLNVLLSYPISNHLEMTSPTRFVASLSEDIVSEDPTSDTWYRNHTFNGYGPSGTAYGPLVYANYGSISDFEYLVSTLKLNLTGTIAITRYGGIFRGLKVKHAQDYGCAGVLIYSDPADDGFTRGTVYPNGPWRPASGVQRGSVTFLSLCAGDPGRADANPDLCGYTTKQLIPQIPVNPISYGDAAPLLAALGGPNAPSSWQGGLNFTYHIGPGPAIVNFTVQVNFTTQPIWNVVATIKGLDTSKEVLLGNHRDAWVFGAVDPNSGTASLLELAKGYGQLLRQGWIPERTIRLLSWDGEEYGLLGSTGWGESMGQELSQTGVIYINVDSAVSGSQFSFSSSPSLWSYYTNATKSVTDPTTNQTLYDAWGTQTNGTRPTGILGSGSDYTVYFDHLGIASSDMGFHGSYGVYHSIYDSFTWMSKFGDPTFNYHKLSAQLWGLIGMRFASDRVLGFNYVDYYRALSSYLTSVQTLASSNGLNVDWTNLKNSLTTFQTFSQQIENVRQYYTSNPNIPAGDVENLNLHLYLAERRFLDPQGLPSRKWFKHVVYAPGIDEGYAPVPFPALVEAINNKNQTQSQQQADLIGSIINNVAQYLGEVKLE